MTNYPTVYVARAIYNYSNWSTPIAYVVSKAYLKKKVISYYADKPATIEHYVGTIGYENSNDFLKGETTGLFLENSINMKKDQIFDNYISCKTYTNTLNSNYTNNNLIKELVNALEQQEHIKPAEME